MEILYNKDLFSKFVLNKAPKGDMTYHFINLFDIDIKNN